MPASGFGSSLINIFSIIKVVIVLLVISVLAIVFLGVPLVVDGHSMDPNFATGEVVAVQRFNFSAANIQRSDVVAANFPADPSHTRVIKRVIGLPGDTVQVTSDGHFIVNGRPLDESAYRPHYGTPGYPEISSTTLESGEYFLAGDNRSVSSDSRLWGPVQASDIEGRVAFIIWPIKK